MSRGIGGFATLACQDENTAIYNYGCYDLNEPGHKNEERLSDGVITISKAAFVKAIIHSKIKHYPHGKKELVEKKIIQSVDIDKLIECGQAAVENSKNATSFYNGVDNAARTLLHEIFKEYQKNDAAPERCFSIYKNYAHKKRIYGSAFLYSENPAIVAGFRKG